MAARAACRWASRAARTTCHTATYGASQHLQQHLNVARCLRPKRTWCAWNAHGRRRRRVPWDASTQGPRAVRPALACGGGTEHRHTHSGASRDCHVCVVACRLNSLGLSELDAPLLVHELGHGFGLWHSQVRDAGVVRGRAPAVWPRRHSLRSLLHVGGFMGGTHARLQADAACRYLCRM